MSRINQALPVDTSCPPIKIADEDAPALAAVRDAADQLDQFRRELGRLVQMTHNLREQADLAEATLRNKRMELLAKYGIAEGRWVIDFENKELIKTDAAAPNTP